MALDERQDRYPFPEIEARWQKAWADRKQFKVTEEPGRPKYYCLEMFPYPSGRIHMGHVRVYAIGDLLARYKWMRGFNVLHPMGWDAFGLPAENAAIDNGVHPAVWTYENIDNMRTQLKRMGISYDWDREVATCDPAYYKWEQLVFIRMLERGLAYRRVARELVPVLPDRAGQRAGRGGPLLALRFRGDQPEIDGWFFKITDYAQELLDWCDRLPGWPERVLTMQRNWIGRSEGAEFALPVAGRPATIPIFTTRPDTFFGMTYAVLAPEHPLVDGLAVDGEERRRIDAFRAEVARETEIERLATDRPKRGLRLKARAVNPFTRQEIPLFLADYVLMGYGTGAIMAVPGEDQRDWDFAKAHDLAIIATVKRPEGWREDQAYTGDGVKINSGFLDGLSIEEAKRKAIDWLAAQGLGQAKINFRLRDWGISRQRYWGAPIPVLYCEKDGMVPEREENLPVVLPRRRADQRQGRLTARGGGELRQRRLSQVRGQGAAGHRHHGHLRGVVLVLPPLLLADLRPRHVRAGRRRLLDAGGPVHRRHRARGAPPPLRALLHEGAARPRDAEGGRALPGAPLAGHGHQGRGEDVEVQGQRGGSGRSHPPLRGRHRAALLALRGPAREGPRLERPRCRGRLALPQSHLALRSRSPRRTEWGSCWARCSRRRAERMHEGVTAATAHATVPARAFRRVIHETIQKVTHDIEHDFHFNTAISAVMELVNALHDFERASLDGMARPERSGLLREAVEATLLLLGPVSPHITEELWAALGHRESLFKRSWPVADAAALAREEVEIVVQVDGRVRGRLTAAVGAQEAEIREMALTDGKVLPWLDGRRVAKVVVVPGRLVNIVTRD